MNSCTETGEGCRNYAEHLCIKPEKVNVVSSITIGILFVFIGLNIYIFYESIKKKRWIREPIYTTR